MQSTLVRRRPEGKQELTRERVDRATFLGLLVSHRQLERADDRVQNMCGLVEAKSAKWYVIPEAELARG